MSALDKLVKQAVADYQSVHPAECSCAVAELAQLRAERDEARATILEAVNDGDPVISAWGRSAAEKLGIEVAK